MKLIKKLILFVLISFMLLLGVTIFSGYKMYTDAINEIDIETKVIDIKSSKDYVYFEDLPKDYITAVIDVEDHRFYRHKGIDVISIIRAIVNNIEAGKVIAGGSTITQQLAKNMYFTQEQKLSRKIAEIFLVYDLESNFDKNEIFELYVNLSYFGNGYYGIGQAAKGYFNKEPKDMTLNESTLLAGVPNAPSVYAPTKNPDLAIKRQKQVIRKMLKQGDLTQEEANELYKEIE